MTTGRVVSWHRAVATVANETLGPNGIFAAINDEDRFLRVMEEIDTDPALLTDLYVSERRPPSDAEAEYPCWINQINRSEYVNNDIVLFTPGGRRMGVSCDNGVLAFKISEVLKNKCAGPDLAEVNLAARILSIRDDNTTSSDRLIILQGGIGCGKSTLLRHFFLRALPAVSSELGKPRYVPAHADLKDFARYKKVSMDEIVLAMLDGLRTRAPELFTPEMRITLASEVDSGFKETLESLRKLDRADEADRLIAERVIKYDQEPLTHLTDISRFYGNGEAEQLVLIIDNVDQHTQDNQLRALEFLWEILVRHCPDAYGLVALREPTLCCREVRDFVETRYLRGMHMTSVSITAMITARLKISQEGHGIIQ